MKGKKSLPLATFEHKRDAYGFAVRPQHLQRYREYSNIYKEEEEERSERWKHFLENLVESTQALENGSRSEIDVVSPTGDAEQEVPTSVDDNGSSASTNDSITESTLKEDSLSEPRVYKVQIWTQVRPLVRTIEQMMGTRVRKRKELGTSESDMVSGPHLPTVEFLQFNWVSIFFVPLCGNAFKAPWKATEQSPVIRPNLVTVVEECREVNMWASGSVILDEFPGGALVERTSQESSTEMPTRRPGLLSRPFGLGWRDRNKGKVNNNDDASDNKPNMEDAPKSPIPKNVNGQ